MIHLSFVCLGNICRSPTAEGIMQDLIDKAGLTAQILVDSAGTSANHIGEKPDKRSQMTAQKRGIVLQSLARQFEASDFERFDYVLAMDSDNYNILNTMHSSSHPNKLFLFRSFDPASPTEAAVPDPYYGGPDGFEKVFDICLAASQGLLLFLKETHKLQKD